MRRAILLLMAVLWLSSLAFGVTQTCTTSDTNDANCTLNYDGNATTGTVTVNYTAGNMLVVFEEEYNNSAANPGAPTATGFSFTACGTALSAQSYIGAAAMFCGTSSSSNNAVAITLHYDAVNVAKNGIVVQVPGGSVDKVSSNQVAGSSTSSLTSNTTATTTHASEVLVGACGGFVLSTPTITAGSSWAMQNSMLNTGDYSAFTETQTVGSTGAYAATATSSTSFTEGYNCFLATIAAGNTAASATVSDTTTPAVRYGNTFTSPMGQIITPAAPLVQVNDSYESCWTGGVGIYPSYSNGSIYGVTPHTANSSQLEVQQASGQDQAIQGTVLWAYNQPNFYNAFLAVHHDATDVPGGGTSSTACDFRAVYFGSEPLNNSSGVSQCGTVDKSENCTGAYHGTFVGDSSSSSANQVIGWCMTSVEPAPGDVAKLETITDAGGNTWLLGFVNNILLCSAENNQFKGLDINGHLGYPALFLGASSYGEFQNVTAWTLTDYALQSPMPSLGNSPRKWVSEQ